MDASALSVAICHRTDCLFYRIYLPRGPTRQSDDWNRIFLRNLVCRYYLHRAHTVSSGDIKIQQQEISLVSERNNRSLARNKTHLVFCHHYWRNRFADS